MKKIILLICIFLTFGCSVKVEMVIENDIVTENLYLYSEEIDLGDKESNYATYKEEYPIDINEEFRYYDPYDKLDGVKYYEKKIYNSIYGYDAKYKASFEFDEYKNSRLLNTSFENYNIGYDLQEKFYYIYIQNPMIYNYDNSISNISISINLKDYEIIENNANTIDGNILTWTFYKYNYNKTDNIILKYKKMQENTPDIQNPNNNENNNNNNNNNNQIDNSNDLILVVSLLLGFVVIITIVILLSKKVRK